MAQHCSRGIGPLRASWRQRTGTLSGGERQMRAIDRPLMGRSWLLLCDEPSFALAPLLTQAPPLP